VTTESELVSSVLAEQVKERLLQDIVAGRYPPESRIIETRVAKELGTSQAPVREALRGLEALGLIEILPFRGARVRRPSADELRDAYLVRTELEVLGARLGVPEMTDSDLADLDELHARMRKAADKKDRHAVALADTQFHQRLLSMSGNLALERVWRSLEPYQRTYITLVAPGADEQWTANLHTPILEALHKRDPQLVADALRHHFEEAINRLLKNWTAR
jgi:DNA-binding GntR family transcriptional regulator